VLTLGIDLSAQDAKTAACLLDWRDGSAVGGADGLWQGLSDERLLALMDQADTVGLDAPFGWPDRFRDMVNEWSANRTWEAAVPRSALRFRLTDEFCVKQGRSPLSVSSGPHRDDGDAVSGHSRALPRTPRRPARPRHRPRRRGLSGGRAGRLGV
jgi:hypothetical protein